MNDRSPQGLIPISDCRALRDLAISPREALSVAVLPHLSRVQIAVAAVDGASPAPTGRKHQERGDLLAKARVGQPRDCGRSDPRVPTQDCLYLNRIDTLEGLDWPVSLQSFEFLSAAGGLVSSQNTFVGLKLGFRRWAGLKRRCYNWSRRAGRQSISKGRCGHCKCEIDDNSRSSQAQKLPQVESTRTECERRERRGSS